MRVLAATDGSEDAHAAMAWLTRFPLPAGAELRVVSAVSVPQSAIDVPPVREFQASLREEARRVAEAARAALAPRFATADVHVADGDSREVILRVAETWRADLIVLGARGLGAVAGMLLGSVSLGVARHAHCSVLVVKGDTGRLRGALVALDGSAHSAAAAAFLAQLPLDPGFAIRLLGVVERTRHPTTSPSPLTLTSEPAVAAGLVRQAIEAIVAERRAALERSLAKAGAPLAGAVKSLQRQVVVGHPVDEIVGAAGGPDVDLIVVGSRGLGTIKRFLLGSISEGVLRHADRPVLIVKTEAS
jgi:nucleotide-binding universal stress UspA family protein